MSWFNLDWSKQKTISDFDNWHDHSLIDSGWSWAPNSAVIGGKRSMHRFESWSSVNLHHVSSSHHIKLGHDCQLQQLWKIGTYQIPITSKLTRRDCQMQQLWIELAAWVTGRGKDRSKPEVAIQSLKLNLAEMEWTNPWTHKKTTGK